MIQTSASTGIPKTFRRLPWARPGAVDFLSRSFSDQQLIGPADGWKGHAGMPTSGKILFWNTEHLAEGSSDRKVDRIEQTIQNADADVSLLSEVMATYGRFNVEPHTYGAVTPQTLCYAAVDAVLEDLDMEAEDVAVFDEFAQQMKGGHNVAAFLNRKLIQVSPVPDGWPSVFMVHAKSGASNGVKCTTVCAGYLAENVVAPWIMVGDFNCEPHEAEVWFRHFGLDAVVHSPEDWTHERGAKTSSLDYAISSPGFTSVYVQVLRRKLSDHRPIKVHFELP